MKRTRATLNQPKAVIAYSRVSTEEQAVHGVSLDAQEARLRAYCEAMGLENVEYVVDAGESAKSLRRTGFQAVLHRIRAGEVATLVVLKLDRLTRSVGDLAELMTVFGKTGTALVSVTENLDTGSAAGRMMINMLGVFAQWEREAIAERTSFALAHKRRQGLVYGSVPFGYRREGDRLVEIPEQLAAIETVRRMNDSGTSLRRCGAWLAEQGFTAPRGGAWTAQGVKDMLAAKVRAA